MDGLDAQSLRVGFCLGLLLPFCVFVVRWVWGRLKSPFNPMVVTQTTKKTPWQVLGEALDALFLLVLIIVGLITLARVRPDLIRSLVDLVSKLVSP